MLYFDVFKLQIAKNKYFIEDRRISCNLGTNLILPYYLFTHLKFTILL